MTSAAKNIKLMPFNSLLANDEDTIVNINITNLRSFKDHPFKIFKDENFEKLVESISVSGILTPILVRSLPDSSYEVISGHRRITAAKEVGLTVIPAYVKDYSDEDATIAMVDSNLYREEILPSEKAFAYKMKLEAMKKKQVRKPKSAQVEQNKTSVQQLADNSPDSRPQIQRFIRLTYLSPNLLEMVDCKQLPLNVAVELSYLPLSEQKLLDENTLPSINQAKRFRELSNKGELDREVLVEILNEEKTQPLKYSKFTNNITKHFPPNYSKEKMEKIIVMLLEKYADEIQGG